MSRPQNTAVGKETKHSSFLEGDVSLHLDTYDDFLRSELRSAYGTSQNSGLGKTSLGSMDLLVLNTSDHGTVSLSHDNPNYFFENISIHASPEVSRLESKLSRHRLNDSIEYPADEVTVELSMTDDDAGICTFSSNDERGSTDKCDIREREEKKETESIGDCPLNNSIVGPSQDNVLENSRCNSSLVHSNDAVAQAANNSILNTSGISTIATATSEKRETLITSSSAVTQSKRYNHYDWSYAEETPPRHASKSVNRSCSSEEAIGNKKSFDDASTLATIAVSNTSMVATPDTSFESAPHVDSAEIDGKLPLSPPRKNRTSTSLRVPIEHDTLVVVEGSDETREFRHSSLILQYASAELAKHFVECIPEEGDNVLSEREGTIQFVLHVRVKDASDWCILQPFLEPHAVQPAVVTPLNLPTLLPWFKQLCLNVLLKECDSQLMDHISPPPKMKQTKRKYNTLDDEVVTLTNTLLLGRISVAAGLQRTAKSAFTALSNWMDHRPDVWLQQTKDSTVLLLAALKLLIRCLITNDDESSRDSPAEVDSSTLSYEDLLDVWESMFEPMEASFLFAAMIAYLPTDCVEDQQLNHFSSVKSFLCNPLLPYLLREGILMKQKQQPGWSESSDTPVASTEALAPSVSHLPSSNLDTRWTISDSTTSESNVELALAESPIAPIPRTTSVDSTDTSIHSSHLLQVAEELQAGWNSLWMKLAGTETRSAKSLWHASSHSHPERCPHQVSQWLQTVWKKLNDPPVFGAASDDAEPPPASAAVTRSRSIPASPRDRVRPMAATSLSSVISPSPAITKPSAAATLRRTFAC
jgi:hypothetical protein